MKNIGIIRAIRDEELEVILEWRNSPNVRNNMYTRHPISLEEHLAWWERTQNDPSRRYFVYEIDGEINGVVGFTEIDLENSNASWAFYASPTAPRGTGSQMEFLALEYAFNELKLHKLHCEVLEINMPVVRLHEKFGFKIEGILCEHHKIDERFVSIYKLAIFSKAWSGIRESFLVKLMSYKK